MGTSYDPTTYLNQQATTAPFVSREASAAERLRSSRETGQVVFASISLLLAFVCSIDSRLRNNQILTVRLSD
jgi:hypothetical protein